MTTRNMREGEVDGVDYFLRRKKEFGAFNSGRSIY